MTTLDAHTEVFLGQRALFVTADKSRARKVARRILRGWVFEETRSSDDTTTMFIVIHRKGKS